MSNKNPFDDPSFGAQGEDKNPFSDPEFGKKTALGDIGRSVKAGIYKLPGMVTGLADIAPALAFNARPFSKSADTLGNVTGFKPGQWAKDTQYSQGYQDSQKDVGKAWEGSDAVLADPNASKMDYASKLLSDAPSIAAKYIANPMYSVNQVAESVPAMLAGGAVSKGIMGAGRLAGVGSGTLERAVGEKLAAPIAGGAGEGITQAGQAMGDFNGEDAQKGALSAIGSGLGTAAIGVGAGRLANKMGLETAGTAMAKAGDGTVGYGINAGKRVLGGAASEGLLQELPQSVQEQAWQNYAEGKPLTQGLARAGVEGAISGGFMGAGANIAGGHVAQPTPLPEPTGEIPAPADLGYNPTAGTHTVFPDGSVILNSDLPAGEQAVFDKRYAAQPIKPSEAMGINPAAGVLSKAAAMAVDTGAHEQTLQAAAEQIQQETATNKIAEQTTDTSDTTEKASENTPAFGSAYAQRQATAPKIEPTDILNTDGQPFVTGFSAKRTAEAAGAGFRPFKIAEKQYVVRNFATENIADKATNTTAKTKIESQNAPTTQAQAIEAGAPTGTAGAQPAATDTSARASALETAGLNSQPKENDVVKTAQAVQTAQKGQTPTPPKSINAVPYENRVNPADDSSNRPASGSNSTVPVGVVLPERSGSDLPARPAAVSKDAEKADLAGEKINKEWTAFTPESGTLNVPRAEMPQIKAEHRGAMVNFLKARGIDSTTEDVSADSLKPTQTEFSTAKVNKAKAYEGGDRSILVSSDGHVLDGHHQWLAKREKGEPVKVIKLNAPIKDLLATVKEFPSAGQSIATQNIATEANNTPASGTIEAEKPVPAGLAKMQAGKTAKGTAYFSTTAKAKEFIESNGLKDTHELVKHASGANRWDIVAKAAAPVVKPIANVVQSAKDSGKLIIANASSKIEAKPDQKPQLTGESNADAAIKDVVKNEDLSEKTQAINLLSELQARQAANGRIADDRLESQINQVKKRISSIDEANGQNDKLDAETRSYEAKANPTYSGEPKSDALNEKEKAAKAKMLNALGKLATLASKNTRMNWTPEEEQKLLPIVIDLFDGAMELGAVTFQKAVRYVRDYISKGIDQETADAIPFDTLQGAYIATSGRHKDKGVTPKKEVASFESLAELEAEAKSSLTDTFYEAIKSGNMPKDNPALRKMVESFDGKPADNARLKEAQEELEAAIARTTRDVIAKGKGQRETFDELLRLYNSQPLLNIRTSTSIANMAYSTPAPLAYLTSELAGITQNDTLLEPTGGTGMLAAGANPSKTLANELNDHRAELLRAQGFTVTQDDAANGFKGTFDKVNTNPPFGSIKDDKGNVIKVPVDGYRLGQIDHLIAARALAAMKDDGKATLILGANKVAGGISNDDLIFFNWLYGHYNVTGHFEVEGNLYARQGAGWPVRVISINGRQKSNKTSPIAGTVKRADNWNQVYEYFTDSLATSRTESNPSATTSAGSAGTGETNTKPIRTTTNKPPTGANQRQPAGSTGDNGNVAGATSGAVSDLAKPAKEPVGTSADTKRLDATPAEPDRLDTSGVTAGNRADKPTAPTGASALSSGENQFQASYVPRSSRKDEGVLIPVNMKEPTQDALSKLEDGVGNIDDYAALELGYPSIKELHDALMGLQVDSVASSIHQIKQGKGVVIADQTGIGKGRQAAAIIRWAAKEGHIPVFVTVKPSLFTDMYGDLADIGTNDINPFIMNGSEWISGAGGEKLFSNKPLTHKNKLSTIAATGELPSGSNALFMTYSQINVDNTQRKALTALADKAVFILDESHNAGGASATGEFITSVLGAAKGVTYLSATYAKRPDNMPLYFKTDIGKASADNEGLMAAMAAGGLPLQTVVSNNLVKAGQMFRRERSYDGVNIESKTDSSNQKAHEALSDKTTAALRAIVAADGMFHEVYVKELSKQLAKEGGRAIDNAGNQAQDSVQHTEFSSVVHNFVRQMLLGLKAQSAADDAIAALKRGEKPIIAVENTMGSFLNEYAAANSVTQGGSLGSFDYRTVLSRALARTRVMTEQKANGEKVKKEIPLSALDGLTQSAYAQAQDVIDRLDLDIPVSPIDWMRSQIQKAGYSVAEITGRSLSVDYSAPLKPVLSAISAQEQNDKVQTTRLFNSGKLDALILNVAGSTGISLHASEKFTDQRQRHMIVAQPAQDINIFMQMLGRIHRTGQVKLPKYTILSVDLPTEKRPTALLSKKMKSLNANTSSNTESATSVKTADMLNKYGDQIVGQYLHDNYHLAQALGIEATTEDGEAVEDIARKVTGRLALQPISVQNAFYSEVEGQYSALLDYLNKTNQNDLEPRTFDFDAKELKQEILFEGADKNTPFGEDAIYGEYSIKAQGLPMKPEEINTEIQENLGGKTSEAHVVELGGALIKQFEGFYKTLPDGVQQETANKVLAEGKRFLQDHRIGKTFRVDINGDTFNAVVTNIRSTHKTTGNPLSLSKVQVSIAVNGALRHISVPATQFQKIEVSTIGAGYTVEQLFKEQPADQRETAKIVTGNLLAAYGEIDGTRGTIISFTKADGMTEQGILLPKTFDFTKNTRGDYRLSTGAIALKFLQESDNKDIGRFGIMSRDSIVRVLPNGKGIAVQVPKSKLKGGKYFLDQGLIGVLGDFVTAGNYMKATTDKPAEAVAALELLMKKQALYALPSMAEEAKAIAEKNDTRFSRGDNATGLPTTQVKSITDAIKARWSAAPEIVIAANMDDAAIPQAVRDHNNGQLSQGAQGQPEGFFYAGKVYLIADQLAKPKDVMRVLFHETLGHVGLRGAFGDSLTPILKQIAAMRRAEVAAKAKEYGLDMAKESDRLQAAEEVLANFAEQSPNIGFVRRAVAAIKTWLRENIPAFKNLAMSDSEIIRSFIIPARNFVEHGRITKDGNAGTVAIQRSADSANWDTKQLIDILEGSAFREHGLRGLKIPQQRVVLSIVARAVHDNKIRQAVIELIPINMMNNLSGQKGSSDILLNDPSVLKNLATLNSDNSVAKIIDEADALVRATAFVAAKQIISTGKGGLASRLFPTMEAFKRQLSASMSTETSIATKGATSLANMIRFAGKQFSAASAGKIQDRHVVTPISDDVLGAEGVSASSVPSILQNTGKNSSAFSRTNQQTDTPSFKAWFGDSKVVDADGKPLVVYHGTSADFDVFNAEKLKNGWLGKAFYFAEDKALALDNGKKVKQVFLKIDRPFVVKGGSPSDVLAEAKALYPSINEFNLKEVLAQNGYDGVSFTHWDSGAMYAAFSPEQIKSATGNYGNFDASNPDIRFSRATAASLTKTATDKLNENFSAPGKLSWWHKSFGTMNNLAERSPAFKPVFDAAQGFINDTSYYATEAADMAAKILPKLENWRDLGKSPISATDNKAISAPIFEGTLSWARDESGKPVKLDELETRYKDLTTEEKGKMLLKKRIVTEDQLKRWLASPLDIYEGAVKNRFESTFLKAGVLWTDAELKSIFNQTPEQIGLYKEFRAATDKSLDNMAKAEMLRFGGKDVAGLKDAVMDAKDADEAGLLLRDYLLGLAETERKDSLTDTANGMIERADKVNKLKAEGYAPLSRFGKYSVDVVVDGERQYFGLHETMRDANIMAMKMKAEYGAANVSQGTLSESQFKLFAGITPESLELFGNMLGLDSTGNEAQDKAFQNYLKLTKTNRSAMRRMIHRKGIAGFSEDVGRVLASFVYSNARNTSAALNMGNLGEAINNIPKEQGELKDAAISLADYIKNPQEEAQAVRGLLFAQYLGGSVASAFVNLTQPFAVTFPWLSQYGGAKQSGAQLMRAMKDMSGKNIVYEADLAKALHHAEEMGIVSPQEVHQLMAQASGAGTLRSGDGTKLGDAAAKASNALSKLSLGWGKVFGMAEQLNRRSTFIAAYRIAKLQNMANPAAFAEKAVNETQFVYSKANKMKFGRGAVGGTLMTFKTYSIAYLELLHRMYTQGGPEGKKAVLLALGVMMLMSGSGGLPFEDDILDLVDGLLQKLGYNISSKKAKQQFFEDLFGKAGADFVERGISGLPGMPLDVSGRMGMGNLIPGTGLLMQKNDHTSDVAELFGPMGDMVKRGFNSAGKALTGDVGGAALGVAPTAIRNMQKGAEMAGTGQYKDAKGYKVIETTPLEAALKVIGFQPATVAKVQDSVHLTQQAKDFYNQQAADIRARWAKGISEKDPEQVKSARDDLKAWNEKNPEQKMVANLPAIWKKVHEMNKTKEQRVIDTAPKGMRMQLKRELAAQ